MILKITFPETHRIPYTVGPKKQNLSDWYSGGAQFQPRACDELRCNSFSGFRQYRQRKYAL